MFVMASTARFNDVEEIRVNYGSNKNECEYSNSQYGWL